MKYREAFYGHYTAQTLAVLETDSNFNYWLLRYWIWRDIHPRIITEANAEVNTGIQWWISTSYHTSVIKNCFTIQFIFSLDNCGNNSQHQISLIQKARIEVGLSAGDVTKSWYLILESYITCKCVQASVYHDIWTELTAALNQWKSIYL